MPANLQCRETERGGGGGKGEKKKGGEKSDNAITAPQGRASNVRKIIKGFAKFGCMVPPAPRAPTDRTGAFLLLLLLNDYYSKCLAKCIILHAPW